MMIGETSETKYDCIPSCNTLQLEKFKTNHLYLQKWTEDLSDNLSKDKQAKVQNCFFQIHSCGLIPFKGQRPGQLYKFWFQRVQINGSARCVVYLNSSAIKHPQRAMSIQAKILAEKYIYEYYFLQKVVRDYARDNDYVREETVHVQNCFDLNTYCFMPARNLLLHLRVDIQALLQSGITFEESNESIKNLQQEKIWQLLVYLNKRLDHVREESSEKRYYQKAKEFAQTNYNFHTYQFFEDAFQYLNEIKNEIAGMRQQVSEMVNKKYINHQRLIQICEFIGKLQGPKDRNSQFLLSELQHFKTVYYKFGPTSKYREELGDFIRERMEQIRDVAFTKMKYSIKESNQLSRQIYLNTYGHKQKQLEVLFNQWFYAILMWNKNGELKYLKKPHNSKQNCSLITLKVQHGKGNVRDNEKSTICHLLREFQINNFQWSFENWRLRVDFWKLYYQPKDVFFIQMLLEEELPAKLRAFPVHS